MARRKLVLPVTCQQPKLQRSKGFVTGRSAHAVLYFLGSWLAQLFGSEGHGRDLFGLWTSLNPASHPSLGAEQTEKADAPREPPPVELKPDPTSGMAAAEAEALSESSEQGAPPPSQGQPWCAPFWGSSPTALLDHLF